MLLCSMSPPEGCQDEMDPPRFTFNPKEGIDNPALVVGDDPEPQGLGPRLCHLKRLEGQTFGFVLWSVQGGRVDWDLEDWGLGDRGLGDRGLGDRGLEVRDVEPWSPAQRGGLRDQDRVLEVNEEFVHNVDLRRVVRRIQSCGLHLVLLVLRRDQYEEVVSMGLDLQALARSSKGAGWSRPRLCHVGRHPELGLGMTVAPLQGPRGRFTVDTVAGGAAEEAGVLSGDRLIWIDGVPASALTQSTLNRTVKRGVASVTVLVIDGEGESCSARRRTPVLPAAAQCRGLPHAARTMRLVKGRDGYGFLLRQEKLAASKRTVHVLREVDEGSPAEAMGMRDGDLLLAVNGAPVEALEHDHIVQEIRRSGDRVSLTSMSMSGRDFYRQLDISPLLFHEERDPDERNQNQNQGEPPETDRSGISQEL
ncbi:Na(+)/H(+) exchange regulatory cofactor NHE-RF3-like [Cyclopterus lumpus]|uniref:Na(+)/H(+) exchange regulatory cofactor NHE-RF3-like n=1 Tax=Cyclopterus lumpus TaxID=8103 RepID=UPI0014875775|nr:Na(+)/H(+) exchange regulatory cofactor NHE-RF3-like [Cyclopterus lumpus]